MVKVISLSEKAYALLREMKKEDMSFSDIIIHNIAKQEAKKTKKLKDLANWIKSLPQGRKKLEKISQNHDKIAYGAGK